MADDSVRQFDVEFSDRECLRGCFHVPTRQLQSAEHVDGSGRITRLELGDSTFMKIEDAWKVRMVAEDMRNELPQLDLAIARSAVPGYERNAGNEPMWQLKTAYTNFCDDSDMRFKMLLRDALHDFHKSHPDQQHGHGISFSHVRVAGGPEIV